MSFVMSLTPQTAYKRLNRLLWRGRLPDAKVFSVPNPTMPYTHGVTMDDGIDLFLKPVIVLNSGDRFWGETLIHECLHVAEPHLSHGVVFEKIVRRYFRLAKKEIKGFR